MEPIKIQVDISESSLQLFEARCRAIIDQVFDEKMKAIQQERIKYTRREAAKKLRISLTTLDKHIAEDVIKTQRLGRRILIPETELENFLNRGK